MKRLTVGLVLALFSLVVLAQKPTLTWLSPRGYPYNNGFAYLSLEPPLAPLWYFLPLRPSRSHNRGVTSDGRFVYWTGPNTVTCLDLLTGSVKWEQTDLPFTLIGAAVVGDDAIYVGTAQGDVISLNPLDQGRFGPALACGRVNVNSVGYYKGILFAGTSDGTVHYTPIRATGVSPGSFSIGYGPVTEFAFWDADNAIRFCVGTTSQRLFFFELSGEGGKARLRSYAHPLLPAGGNITDPSYHPEQDCVFVGVGEYVVRVHARFGTIGYRTRLRGTVKGGVAVSPDGTVFVATDAGNVYALRGRDLVLLWRSELGSPVVSPVLITPNYVWVASFQGLLYALESKTGRVRWRYRLADRDINLRNIAILGPIAGAPFGLMVTDATGRIYAMAPATIVKDVTPPIFREPFFILLSASRQQVGYFSLENPTAAEIPAIPGRAPIYLRVLVSDQGTGVDERTIESYLLETRTNRRVDLTSEFEPARGQVLVNVHTVYRREGRVRAATVPPLPDGDYVVVVRAGDYAGNMGEGRFGIRVDNRLPPPELPTTMAGAPTGPGVPGAPGAPGGPGVVGGYGPGAGPGGRRGGEIGEY